MKISNRTYPIIEKLNNNSLGQLPIFEYDKLFFEKHVESFHALWKKYSNKFKSNINIVSQPFVEASTKALPKLLELWTDISTNDVSDMDISGTFIYGDFVFFIDYHIKKGSEDNEIIFFKFSKDGIPHILFADSAKLEIYQVIWLSNYYGLNPNDKKKIRLTAFNEFARILILDLFKSYAQVETKILLPHKILKELDCKYINNTSIEITYLDSKWFTNLVKSDTFKVRGHFRLQPKKINNKWTKELIWISEFQKAGYTAKARKKFNNKILT